MDKELVYITPTVLKTHLTNMCAVGCFRNCTLGRSCTGVPRTVYRRQTPHIVVSTTSCVRQKRIVPHSHWATWLLQTSWRTCRVRPSALQSRTSRRRAGSRTTPSSKTHTTHSGLQICAWLYAQITSHVLTWPSVISDINSYTVQPPSIKPSSPHPRVYFKSLRIRVA